MGLRRPVRGPIVFVYELDPHGRHKLDVPPVELRPKLEVGAGSGHRPEQEFGQAELGDKRRTARLVKSAWWPPVGADR